jgi:hypothetical protein
VLTCQLQLLRMHMAGWLCESYMLPSLETCALALNCLHMLVHSSRSIAYLCHAYVTPIYVTQLM